MHVAFLSVQNMPVFRGDGVEFVFWDYKGKGLFYNFSAFGWCPYLDEVDWDYNT